MVYVSGWVEGRLFFPEIRRRISGEQHGTLAELIAEIIVLALLGVGFLYAADIDGVDFITIWPPWAWAALSIIIVVALTKHLEKIRTIFGVALAIIMALVLSEETRFMARALWHSPEQAVASATEQETLLNVVTINCEKKNTRSIEDALALDTDVIMVQETPDGTELDDLVPAGWDHAAWDDCAVLVRGTAHATGHPVHLKDKVFVVEVTPTRTGRPLTVMSVHMVLPPVWNRVWGKDKSKSARELRRTRARTIKYILEERDRYGEDLPVVIGGDFNVPGGHWIMEPLLESDLTDVFDEVGYGWPNTIPASYPMERIDFIWTCSQIEPLSARIIHTAHSDHRMVRAQVRLR